MDKSQISAIVADGHREPLTQLPLSLERATELAQCYKALGDPVRLRLLSLIASHLDGEICVCDLVGAFDLAQSTISHHLKILRDAGLVESQRRGTWVYYWISPTARETLGPVLGLPPYEAGSASH
ncbi:winged helix-turn-helix transcriptional regulator [Streptomyces sp. NA02950]|uniref:ArsR/SmtB family transcription factor n=1 Tax=Streptomyces sp. NA02950 TaxID=2742137 RepID=UPI0015913239|nr:metalloregulator ArsR/SmtB family transcription factor [Streptomyces sp. NA02950]QKV93000.1 winged helix-turn-helix transcriptional regulator [Streptomyces sp. NA02950]